MHSPACSALWLSGLHLKSADPLTAPGPYPLAALAACTPSVHSAPSPYLLTPSSCAAPEQATPKHSRQSLAPTFLAVPCYDIRLCLLLQHCRPSEPLLPLCARRSLEPLSHLKGLQTLDVSCNLLSHLEGVQGLEDLQQLDVTHNLLPGAPPRTLPFLMPSGGPLPPCLPRRCLPPLPLIAHAAVAAPSVRIARGCGAR